MKYMLDSNICIYIMKNDPEKVAVSFKKFHAGDIAVSSIVLSELVFGAYKSKQLQNNLIALKEFMEPINILSYNESAAYCYGELRASLEKNGTPIGALDTLIAAHALSINATLITNNTKEFSRIKHLRCENWV